MKLVCSGAGAAALACLNLQVSLGLDRGNIFVTDIKGVVYQGRKEEMDPDKERYAQDTKARTLDDIIGGADIFLGLSAGGVLTAAMVKKMADKPIILAMANPGAGNPARSRQGGAAGLPDRHGPIGYPEPGQQLTVFPIHFPRGARLRRDHHQRGNEARGGAGLAELARAEPSEIVALAYGEQTPPFGPDYLIPRAFDPRLVTNLAPAVAKAAMDSGVASRPIKDFDAYRDRLMRFVYQSGTPMEPVFAAAKNAPKRVVYAEGEDERVLRAAQVAVDEGIARPLLVGRIDVMTARIQSSACAQLGDNCDGVNILDDPRHREYGLEYYQLMRRKGVSRAQAMEDDAQPADPGRRDAGSPRRRRCDAVRNPRQLCGTPEVCARRHRSARQRADARGDADADPAGAAAVHLRYARQSRSGCASEIAEMTLLAAEEVQRFGLKPSVALLSHSSFGSSDAPAAQKMRDALAIILARAPGLAVEGEMRADSALSKTIRDAEFPGSASPTMPIC